MEKYYQIRDFISKHPKCSFILFSFIFIIYTFFYGYFHVTHQNFLKFILSFFFICIFILLIDGILHYLSKQYNDKNFSKLGIYFIVTGCILFFFYDNFDTLMLKKNTLECKIGCKIELDTYDLIVKALIGSYYNIFIPVGIIFLSAFYLQKNHKNQNNKYDIENIKIILNQNKDLFYIDNIYSNSNINEILIFQNLSLANNKENKLKSFLDNLKLLEEKTVYFEYSMHSTKDTYYAYRLILPISKGDTHD